MKPFASPTQMLDAHEAMFGQADRQAVEIVLKWAPKLFAVPLDPLSVRVVRAVVAWLTATPEAREQACVKPPHRHLDIRPRPALPWPGSLTNAGGGPSHDGSQDNTSTGARVWEG